MDYTVPLIQTKLQLPVQSIDPVPRPRLAEWLDQRWKRPLTLVSAPAGYGKSTLISEWVRSLDCPSAWLSLDQYDNDLRVFLDYFITAIRSIHPQKLTETQALLGAPEMPPLRYLSGSLINELNEIEGEYVFVLDDYNMIELQSIHDLVNELIQHAPKGMHLVLCTRMDPPLPLVKLRATGQISEIRGQDLSFTLDEAHILVQNILGTHIDRDETNTLVARSEGWVTGIRLAALALRHRRGNEAVKGSLSANNRYVMEYLVSEILENQVAVFSEWLLKTSILERFCTDLCEAVCATEAGSKGAEINGQEFFNWLEASNLFVIHLDDKGLWVRYHHLFQDFLQNELASRITGGEIAVLHSLASAWYADNGLIDEALRHALSAGDVMSAAQLVEQNIYRILRTGLFPVLGRWLDQLPEEIVAQQPKLLVARAWVSHFQGTFEQIPPILQKIDNLSEIEQIEQELKGDLDFFDAVLSFWDYQVEASLKLFHRAISRMSSANLGGRNEAELYYAVACHMTGKRDEVIQKYRGMLQNEISDSPRYGYLLASLAFVYLLSGNLARVYETAQQMAAFSDKTNNVIISGWAFYLIGYVNFEWNNLNAAIKYFAKAVDKRFFLDVNSPVDCFAGLIYSFQALGQPGRANETADLMVEFAQESNNPRHLILARSVQARLSLLQGDQLSAVRWLDTEESSEYAGTFFFWLEQPRLTQCRALIAKGSEDSLRQAEVRLQGYWQESQDTYNTPRMIEILLLQVLIQYKQEQIDEALVSLERALNLARPGGYIRLFVELGPEFASLLDRLKRQGITPDYIGNILAAYPSDGNIPEEKTINQQSQVENLVEPLTNREYEILELLGKRLTNKEIAAQLVIAPGTVEQHLVRINSKLNVRGRRQAVAKARELGLLSS
jgi:LuxR family maltose regulon positive regulatory protein